MLLDQETIELQKILEETEPEIQAFIKGDDWKNTVHQIARKHQLDSSDEQGLRNEILLILINISSWQEFLAGLRARLVLAPEKIGQISTEIKTLIFDKIGIVFDKGNEQDEVTKTINQNLVQLFNNNLATLEKVATELRKLTSAQITKLDSTILTRNEVVQNLTKKDLEIIYLAGHLPVNLKNELHLKATQLGNEDIKTYTKINPGNIIRRNQ